MINSKSYGLQNETRQYLRRLYSYGKELASADIADIDNFIKGCKQLNMWNRLVCWPLRSIHNIGTGSIVLAFGGDYKGYDGLTFNSPTWGLNGISFSNPTFNLNTQAINILSNISTKRLNSFVFACGMATNFNNFNRFTDLQDGTGNGYNSLLQWNSDNFVKFWMPNKGIGSSPTVQVGYTATTNQFITACGSKQGLTMRSTVNGATTATSNAINSNFSLPTSTNIRTICGFFNGTVSFVCLSDSDRDFNFVQTFNNLYKNTLGKGLGLV